MGITGWTFIWTAIMPLAVILYYFFRKKYENRSVSSILYWTEWMRETEVSPFLKKLQRNALFYLQLAALLLLVFALLGPYFKSETLAGSSFIFIVDPSATMLAGNPAHFERQKEEMIRLARRAGGKPITIITAGQRTETVIQNEREIGTVEEAIRELAVTYERDELEKALYFAGTLADPETTAIHVFTDELDRSILADKSWGQIVVHAREEQLENVSIRQFGLARTDGGMRAVVQLVNDSSREQTGQLKLSNGSAEQVEQIALKEGEEKILSIDELDAEAASPGEEAAWEAEILVGDDYGADNRAAAFARADTASAAVDAGLHELVAKGFQAAGQETATVQPDQLAAALAEGFAVTNQTGLLESASPILLIGRDDAELSEAEGRIETETHPLFAYASLNGVFISGLYPPFPDYETIARVGGEPFIQLSPEGDIVVLTDVEQTDWPLHPSFPLFLWSAANELTGSEAFLGSFAPNEQRAVTLQSVSGEWELFRNGEYVSTYQEGEGVFTAPAEPGIYELVGEEQKTLIVSLPAAEKELTAGQSYRIGEAGVQEETVNYSIVPYLAVLILLILLAEWEVYRRGIAHR